MAFLLCPVECVFTHKKNAMRRVCTRDPLNIVGFSPFFAVHHSRRKVHAWTYLYIHGSMIMAPLSLPSKLVL